MVAVDATTGALRWARMHSLQYSGQPGQLGYYWSGTRLLAPDFMIGDGVLLCPGISQYNRRH